MRSTKPRDVCIFRVGVFSIPVFRGGTAVPLVESDRTALDAATLLYLTIPPLVSFLNLEVLLYYEYSTRTQGLYVPADGTVERLGEGGCPLHEFPPTTMFLLHSQQSFSKLVTSPGRNMVLTDFVPNLPGHIAIDVATDRFERPCTEFAYSTLLLLLLLTDGGIYRVLTDGLILCYDGDGKLTTHTDETAAVANRGRSPRPRPSRRAGRGVRGC